MASRVLNRHKLREQANAAPAGAAAPVAAVPARKNAQAKAATQPRPRNPRAKKPPPRMFARWGVFDGGMKRVAIFNYNQRDAADEKLADLNAKKKGGHFLQIVKEPMPEPAAE